MDTEVYRNALKVKRDFFGLDDGQEVSPDLGLDYVVIKALEAVIEWQEAEEATRDRVDDEGSE